MIPQPTSTRIFLACGVTDMRKGFDDLAVLVQQVLQEKPHSGALFAYRGRRGDLIELLWFDSPLKGLLGDLIDVWHFSLDAGAIKPERAFYAGVTAKFGCEADDLLMVGDTWRNDIVGAVDAGSRAKWLNRDPRPTASCLSSLVSRKRPLAK